MRQRRASRASKLEETCHRRRRLLARLADAAALARRDRRRRARVGISKISAAFRKTSPFARRTSTVGAPSRRIAEKTVLIREAYDLRLALHRKGMERSDATRGQGIEAGEAGARPPRPVSHRRRQYPGNRAGVRRLLPQRRARRGDAAALFDLAQRSGHIALRAGSKPLGNRSYRPTR